MHSIETIVGMNETVQDKDVRVLDRLEKWIQDAAGWPSTLELTGDAASDSDIVSVKIIHFIQDVHKEVLWPLVALAQALEARMGELKDPALEMTVHRLRSILVKLGRFSKGR